MRTLERITVTGYKSIRELRDFELGDINVLIGANGAGKSNFLSIFKLLDFTANNRLQLYVGQNGGADFLLRFGRKTTNQTTINLDFVGKDEQEKYKCELTLAPAIPNKLILAEEKYLLRQSEIYTEDDWQHLHWRSGTDEINAQFSRGGIVDREIWGRIRNWRGFHFQDTTESAKVKQTNSIYENDGLKEDAGNLAAYLYLLQHKYKYCYDRIVKTIRLAAPFFDDFSLRPSQWSQDTIRLEWLHKGAKDTFDVSQLSDGTLRFICLTTLLLQPNPPSLIIIDEPELGLHPAAIGLLVEMLQSVATKSQVIISTQSVSMVNQFRPEEIIVVDQEKDESVFKRLSSKELESWLDEYSIGELWEMNVIGGRP